MLLPSASVISLISVRRGLLASVGFQGLSTMACQIHSPSPTAAAAAAEACEVDIQAYINSVEEELIRSRGEVMTKKLSEPNRKPMIRTLLGIDDKAEFDARLRNTRKETEYKRLEAFVRNDLRPALQREGRLELVPGKTDIIADALAQPPTSGAGAFRKLGTGPVFRGNTTRMVEEIAPEILSAYGLATAELTEMDVLGLVIGSRKFDVSSERIDAANRCLGDFISCSEEDYHSASSKTSQLDVDDTSCPKLNGKQCELDCTEYLESQMEANENLIGNVYVNHKSALNRPKYQDGNVFRSGSGSDASSGIIWTTVERDNACSEFDGVVYKRETSGGDGEQCMAIITEIWEAKVSISPATIWDAVTKKCKSIRDLMEDEEAYLNHDGRQMPLRFGSGEKLVFGIYGQSVLSPENAIGQMISMAAAQALGDVDTVLDSLDRGYIEVGRDKALNDLEVLQSQLCSVEELFHIRMATKYM